jgi:hypothetical protein
MKRTDIFFALAAVFLLPLAGCSYLMDAVESAITKRASFSIDASYVPPNSVVITWDETVSSEDFAGYEIYMTEDPDDEFVGYVAVAARYDLGSSGLPAGLVFQVEPSLGTGATASFTHDVGLLALAARGTYFYRVGVINWDEDSEDRPWGYETDPGYYIGRTTLYSISGYAMVEIP